MAWATVAGHRTGDNPARWGGNLKELLPKPSKVSNGQNQPALSLADAPRWFEALRQRNPRNAARAMPHLVGAKLSYADLSLFQLVEGLQYALPKATRKVMKKTPRVAALHEGVAKHQRLSKYLASERRLPFNQEGIFRHYPELDG